MSQTEPIEVPPQPRSERNKLRLMNLVAAIIGLAVALGNAPYDIGQQSTIMVKSETAMNIWAARDTYHKWPKDARDRIFGFGRLGLAERTAPTFQYLRNEPDEKNAEKENAVYDLLLRGEHLVVKIGYDPNERKPK